MYCCSGVDLCAQLLQHSSSAAVASVADLQRFYEVADKHSHIQFQDSIAVLP